MSDLLTVVTPATASRLTTREAAKASLGITDSSSDATIDSLIDRASASIVRACRGRVFGRETVTETWRATGSFWCRERGMDRGAAPLLLARAPVAAFASLTENGTALVADVDYEVDTSAGLLWRLCGSTRSLWHCRPIVATYTAGWLLPDEAGRTLPFDIEDVCLELVSRAFNAIGRDGALQSEQQEGVGRLIYFAQPGGGMTIDDGLFGRLAPFCANWT